MILSKRDHGGRLGNAIKNFGGTHDTWLDFSTGINPNSYPIPEIPKRYWQALPDGPDTTVLQNAAIKFWNVPDGTVVIPASGVSALIAILPQLVHGDRICLISPTYNEFEAAFTGQGWLLADQAPVRVYVNPNNPDGRLFTRQDIERTHETLTVIDESFCDTCPENSMIDLARHPGYIILKSIGKFWGLGGMRLGFAVTHPDLAEKIQCLLGPWPISGPAQFIGQKVLSDQIWARKTRTSLHHMSKQLDTILNSKGGNVIGGTSLFRLVDIKNAYALYTHLCRHHILTRVFPYAPHWMRFGLPKNATDLSRLEVALGCYQ